MRISRSKFHLWLMAAAMFVFAVLASGGCGGSGGGTVAVTNNDGQESGESAELYLPSMFEIRAIEEFTAMTDELKVEGIWDKIDSLTFYNVFDSIDSQVISNYNNGGVLTMYYPTENDLEKAFAFLKSMSADISMLDISADIEIIAITKRTASGTAISEDNILQLDNIFVYVVPDISTLVSADGYTSPDEVEEAYLKMQIDRWRRYFCWLASLDDRTQASLRTAANIDGIASGNNNIVDVSKVVSGTYDFSYSKLWTWDAQETSPDNTRIDTWHGQKQSRNYMSYSASRNNMLDYQIYSVHSFTDHCDYFVVGSSLYTNPITAGDSYCLPPIRQGVYTVEFPYIRGFTRAAELDVSMTKNSANAGSLLTTSMPDGAAHGTVYSENFTWKGEGIFAGDDFGVFDGVSFSKPLSYDAANITVLNDSDRQSAKFTALFDWPADSSSTESGFSAYSASITANRLPTYSVFKVSSGDWKAGYDAVQVSFSGRIREGASLKGYYYYDTHYPRINAVFSKNFHLSVKTPIPPKHSTTHQRYYACNRHEIAAAVRVFSESDWNIELESGAESWITFEKTSGKATGSEGEWVVFTIHENTSGSGRHANMYLVSYPYNDKTKQERTLFELHQSNNERIGAE